MTKAPEGIEIAPALPRSARAFVFSSFASGFTPHAGTESAEGFHRACLEPFERAVDAGRVLIRVARLKAEPDELVGWSAVLGDALVYVYVKHVFRRRGIARSLVPEDLERAVFRTPSGDTFQRRRYGKLLQPAPYLLSEAEAA